MIGWGSVVFYMGLGISIYRVAWQASKLRVRGCARYAGSGMRLETFYLCTIKCGDWHLLLPSFSHLGYYSIDKYSTSWPLAC